MVWEDSIVVLTEFLKTWEKLSPKLQRTDPFKTHPKTLEITCGLDTPNTLKITYIISEPSMEAAKKTLSGSSQKKTQKNNAI